MAVSSSNGCSALADIDYLKRSFNGVINYVNDGLLGDMDNLTLWLLRFVEDKKKLREEINLLRAENAELRENNRKLQTRIHEFTQKEFDTKNQKKKMEKEFASYVKRVRIALGIIDQERISGLPAREQECIRELSNVTNNFNPIASVRRASTNLADFDESQEASWLFNEGERDASRDLVGETSIAPINISRTRSGRAYSRCPMDDPPIQLPPKPPVARSPPNGIHRRRSRSTDNKLAAEQVSTKPTIALGRRSRSETRILEPLMSLTRSPSSSLARPHVFMQDVVVKSHTCAACQKKSRFGSVMMRCSDCGQLVHLECRNDAPVPCWGKRWNSPASTGTPRVRWGVGQQDNEKTLASYVNELPPFVPAIVIQCIKEVETRGLTESGVYRLNGSIAEIRDLKKQLYQGKIPPNLSYVHDINVITGVLKDFFNSLPDPVVPNAVRQDFVNALDLDFTQQTARMKDLVKNLTDAHHDTLVYLLLHLQRVASHPATNMPVRNLARVLAPTVFGPCNNQNSVAVTRDAELVSAALEALLNIPYEYWLKQLCLETKSILPKTPSSTTKTHPAAPTTTSESESTEVTRNNSTNSAVGHTVRSFFSRPESAQQPRMFTNPSKKSRHNKDNR